MKKQAFKLSFLIQNLTPVKFFVVMAVLFGLVFAFITPPFEAPDEPVHFFRSYQVSTLNFSVDKVGTTYGGLMPASLQDTISATWDKSALAFHPNLKYPLGYTRDALSIKTTDHQHVYDFSTTAYYSPVSYIPQALGIGIARVLSLPPIIMMYFGRIFNLAAWILLFSLAINFLPRRKWALVFLALIPMALFQAASLSADVMATGLVALLMSMILRYISLNKQLSKLDLAWLVAVAVLLALSKQIMFLFVPLLLLLGKNLFASKRQAYLLKAVLIVVPLAFFAIWSLHVHGIPQSNSVGGIDPPAQEKFILHHPLRYILALINVYFFNWGDGIVKSFFGNFGWVDTPLSEFIVVAGYISMTVLLLAHTGQYKAWLNQKQKAYLSIIAAIYVLAVSTALYVYFTPVGFKIIVGLVGRYYLPAAIILIPVLHGRWMKVSPAAYRRLAIWSPVILLVSSSITIFIRYYINNV